MNRYPPAVGAAGAAPGDRAPGRGPAAGATSAAGALDIAVIDDEAVLRDALHDFLRGKGHRPRTFASGGAALAAFRAVPPDIALLDIRMPGEDGLATLATLRSELPELPVIMVSGDGSIDAAISALRHGAADFLRKPVRYDELLAALERVQRLMLAERDRDRLRATLARHQAEDDGFIAASPACREIVAFLAAAGDTPFDGILITGETGTGKDVLARALHQRLHGVQAPFVAVNCPALPETLVESELFGHVKGAFTGADADHPGAFELADGGTLFLDELGDLARSAQAKLLRAIESRQVRRLGGRRDLAVQVTIIAATNQDLPAMVEQGAFRRDLLYRLNTFQLAIPPLRERCEDVPALAQRFLAGVAARRRLPDAGFTPEALAALQAYDFPGNVRELRNLVERAALLSRDGRIDLAALALPRPRRAGTATAPTAAAGPMTADTAAPAPLPASTDPERQATLDALHAARWNRRAAARALGISYEALRWRIEKHGLDR